MVRGIQVLRLSGCRDAAECYFLAYQNAAVSIFLEFRDLNLVSRKEVFGSNHPEATDKIAAIDSFLIDLSEELDSSSSGVFFPQCAAISCRFAIAASIS